MSSSRTDVFRNGSHLATVRNSGAYSDRLGRHAHGTYTYRVCAAGTSTCSPDVSVTVGGGASRHAGKASRTANRLLQLKMR
jgi:hypothetical protein